MRVGDLTAADVTAHRVNEITQLLGEKTAIIRYYPQACLCSICIFAAWSVCSSLIYCNHDDSICGTMIASKSSEVGLFFVWSSFLSLTAVGSYLIYLIFPDKRLPKEWLRPQFAVAFCGATAFFEAFLVRVAIYFNWTVTRYDLILVFGPAMAYMPIVCALAMNGDGHRAGQSILPWMVEFVIFCGLAGVFAAMQLGNPRRERGMLLFSFVKFGYLFLLLYRNYKQYGGLTVPKIRGHSEVPPLIGISGSWNVGPETSGLDPSTRDDCSRDQRTATDTKEPVFEWQHDFIVQGIFQPRIVACIRSSVISLLLQRQ
jgi:hypothetical protein